MPGVRVQLQAAMLLVAARVLLARRGTTATLRSLTRRRGRHGRMPTGVALRAVQRAGRVVGGTCLAQSVALAAMLEQAEQHATLVLGCRRENGKPWTAHAWVLVDGEMLEPVRGDPHAELARLEGATGWVPIQSGSPG